MKKLIFNVLIVLALQAGFVGQTYGMNNGLVRQPSTRGSLVRQPSARGGLVRQPSTRGGIKLAPLDNKKERKAPAKRSQQPGQPDRIEKGMLASKCKECNSVQVQGLLNTKKFTLATLKKRIKALADEDKGPQKDAILGIFITHLKNRKDQKTPQKNEEIEVLIQLAQDIINKRKTVYALQNDFSTLQTGFVQYKNSNISLRGQLANRKGFCCTCPRDLKQPDVEKEDPYAKSPMPLSEKIEVLKAKNNLLRIENEKLQAMLTECCLGSCHDGIWACFTSCWNDTCGGCCPCKSNKVAPMEQ